MTPLALVQMTVPSGSRDALDEAQRALGSLQASLAPGRRYGAIELHPRDASPDSTTRVTLTLPGDVRDAVRDQLGELTNLPYKIEVFDDPRS